MILVSGSLSDTPVIRDRSGTSLPEYELDTKTGEKFDKYINNAIEVINKFLNPKVLKDDIIPRELLFEAQGFQFL